MDVIHNAGPDQILLSNVIKTSEADGAVQLQTTEYGTSSDTPVSVYSMFKSVMENKPHHPAMAVKRNNKWVYWSLKEYFEQSRIVAKAFIKLGLDRFHGVCIMGFNSPEWLLANYGCIFAGGLSAGIYTTNSPDACQHVALNCKAQIIVVENVECLNKILAIKRFLPDLKAIIQWSEVPGAPGVISWSELFAIGNNESDGELDQRLKLAAVNQCCTLIYTSGTTGPPKGVMCSQDSLTWIAAKYVENHDIVFYEAVVLSYLPLSHLAAQMTDIFLSTLCGATVYFAQPDALKGSLGPTLVEVQPTFFLAVPRVWEKIYEKMQEVASQSGPVKRKIGAWAKYHGLNYHKATVEGRELTTYESINYHLAKKLLFNKIKHAIGMSRVVKIASGAAPIDGKILEYFQSIDLPIIEGYGLSESLSLCSFNQMRPGDLKLGTVGKILPQTSVKLMDMGAHRPGEGEICMKGRNICMGYLRMEDKTNETIDDDGWLHTGDIGKFDSDGFLVITGRIKELVITAGGENVPPVMIEEAIKNHLPIAANVMLVGDKRRFLSVLIALKSEVDDNSGHPKEELTIDCAQHLQEAGLDIKTVSEAREHVKNDPKGVLSSIIDEAIKKYNEQDAVSNAQKVQRWVLLPHDFSLPTGELNNTLKLKRSYVLDKYSDLIDQMYETNVTSKL